MTVYGGPDDGRYSNRIVGTINDRNLEFDDDGNFEFTLSPEPQPGTWLKLDPDAVHALTRDYLTEPATGPHAMEDRGDRPARAESRAREDLAQTVSRGPHLAARADVVPAHPMYSRPTVAEPFPVPQHAYGWSAADAAYAMGAYDLKPDQALVIDGTSPECVFWNLCLWNPFLHTYDYTYERVTINGAHVDYETDGSWRIVVSDKDPGHPNWVSTAGRARGLIWLRWFLPEQTPARPTCQVVDVADLNKLMRG